MGSVYFNTAAEELILPIEPVGRPALCMRGQQHISSRKTLGWYDGPVRVLYEDLKASDSNYCMCKDEADEAYLV